VGGFGSEFTRPSIEDIELGYRLLGAGYRIRLEKSLEVKHLKRWTLRSMLSSDIFDRALPWTRLLKRRTEIPEDLNLTRAARISAGLCWLLLVTIPVALLWPWAWLLLALEAVALLALNARLYRYLLEKRGPLFMLGAIPLHWLYYLYSSAVFVFVWFFE
jgi:hypothetical protein